MVSLAELRKKSIALLEEKNIEEARADTDFLLFFLTGATKGDIISGRKIIDDETEKVFSNALRRRLKGEPVQYITGICEFMSLEFTVNTSTLIPRADTEILVEECIRLTQENDFINILDIGTGSGCIGLSIAHYCKSVKPYLLDISKEALKVAEKNSERLGLCERTGFINMDILSTEADTLGEFDLIVSNPPYIETLVVEELDEKVKDFEPRSALDGGADGLLFYRRITEIAAGKAKYLAFEIGYNQKDTVREIMQKYFKDIRLLSDYGNNPRVLVGKNIQI